MKCKILNQDIDREEELLPDCPLTGQDDIKELIELIDAEIHYEEREAKKYGAVTGREDTETLADVTNLHKIKAKLENMDESKNGLYGVVV